MLSKDKLLKMREFAIDNFMDKKQTPDETHGIFMARCWADALIRALNSYGYKVIIQKDNVSQELQLAQQ